MSSNYHSIDSALKNYLTELSLGYKKFNKSSVVSTNLAFFFSINEEAISTPGKFSKRIWHPKYSI